MSTTKTMPKPTRPDFDRHPVNRFRTPGIRCVNSLKLIETRIVMFKSQLKIYLDSNLFEEVHEIATKLSKEVNHYNRMYDQYYPR